MYVMHGLPRFPENVNGVESVAMSSEFGKVTEYSDSNKLLYFASVHSLLKAGICLCI